MLSAACSGAGVWKVLAAVVGVMEGIGRPGKDHRVPPLPVQESCWAILAWTHQDMCPEACKRFPLWCGVLEMLKAQGVGHAHGITPCKQLSNRPSNVNILPGGETPL